MFHKSICHHSTKFTRTCNHVSPSVICIFLFFATQLGCLMVLSLHSKIKHLCLFLHDSINADCGGREGQFFIGNRESIHPSPRKIYFFAAYIVSRAMVLARFVSLIFLYWLHCVKIILLSHLR